MYYPDTSETSRALGFRFTASFEDEAEVSGENYTETVRVGGLEVVDQTIGVAIQYSLDLKKDRFAADGILGMAFERVSTFGAPSVAQSLMSQGLLDDQVFSVKLARSGSELFFGGANSALYTGDFSYTSLSEKGQGHWQVMVEAIGENGRPILSNTEAIIDTGATLITLSSSDAALFYSELDGTDASSTVGPGYYTFPCDKFPSVSFTFGGTIFPMSKETLNAGKVSPDSSDCVATIVGKNITNGVAVFGTYFLQNVYTSFDIRNERIGFADLA